jgi:hypothetical protein
VWRLNAADILREQLVLDFELLLLLSKLIESCGDFLNGHRGLVMCHGHSPCMAFKGSMYSAARKHSWRRRARTQQLERPACQFHSQVLIAINSKQTIRRQWQQKQRRAIGPGQPQAHHGICDSH